jgi:DMSO/TMAO reductase YedYZ molybdopterin-dependent catalytic subunit
MRYLYGTVLTGTSRLSTVPYDTVWNEVAMNARPVTLPPGQRLIDGFPRFGTNLARRPPSVPIDPVIEIRGERLEAFVVPLTALATLPRLELAADFHCVAGWSATGLRWEGAAFEAFYCTFITPAVLPGTSVTHLVFHGLDRYQSIMTIDDALAEDVLLADHLDGRPLDGDHGAPIRLVSPAQYGYLSTKHLCGIEVCTAEPKHGPGSPFRKMPARLLCPHPRGRVQLEERHRHLPGWALRSVYRSLIEPIRRLGA